jgi:hypothetical protein
VAAPVGQDVAADVRAGQVRAGGEHDEVVDPSRYRTILNP